MMESDREHCIPINEPSTSSPTKIHETDRTSGTTLGSEESHEPLIDVHHGGTAPASMDGSTRTSSSDRSGDSTDQLSAERSRMTMKQKGLKCCAVGGLITAVIWATLALSFPLLYHSIINKQMSLQPGTFQYKSFLDSPVQVYLRLYLFNITNARQVEENQTKPILNQLGPYTFTEKHERVNMKFHDNGTLTFQQKRVWHFVPELSNGTLEDNVTTINVPLVGASYTLRHQPLWFKVAFNRIIKVLHSRFFVTKTAGEFLFDGYKDPLLDLAQRMPAGTFPPFDKFGWLYTRNNSETYDGVFNIFTGVDRIDRFGEMDRWNYESQTRFYDSYCGMVNGSFGEGWAPRRNRSEISIFVTDFCRTFTLDYEKDVVNVGVPSYRFSGSERIFSNGTGDKYRDNWCFCSSGICNPSGVGNVSLCRYNLPVFVSFPHYYLADPYYGDMVVGLKPEEELHKLYVDMEPEMAVPTKVRARFQVNILVEPDIDIDAMEKAKRMYVPMVWFEVMADITPELGWYVNMALSIPVIGTATFFGLVCLSVLAVAISGVILVKRRSGTHPIASAATAHSASPGHASSHTKNHAEA